MARAKDLAGLAALGALGYMLTRDKNQQETKGRLSEDAGYKSTETREKSAGDKAVADTNSSVLTALQKPKNIREEGIAAANDVRSSRISPAAVKDNTTSIRMPSGSPDLEASMTRGTRSVRNDNYSNEGRSLGRPLSTVSSSAEGMKNYKSRRNVTPTNTVSSSEEGMRNYKPRVSAAAPFKGGQPGYDEAGNFLGGRRGYDEAGNPMKKGGKVKKMASGGMTASKRADGIASKGKTKCKMY